MAGRKSDFTLTKLDDLFSTQEQRDEEKLSKIRDIPLTEIAGVYSPKQKIEDSKVPVTLGRLLEKDKTIRRIVLHLDNDIAGRKATKALQTILSDKYEVVDDPPQYGKDVNDFLCKRLGIKDKTERSFAR